MIKDTSVVIRCRVDGKVHQHIVDYPIIEIEADISALKTYLHKAVAEFNARGKTMCEDCKKCFEQTIYNKAEGKYFCRECSKKYVVHYG